MGWTEFVDALNHTTSACPVNLDSFPDLFREPPVNIPNLIVCTLVTLYIFIGLAIICEDYLVPAVVLLCYKCNIPYDIGGATLLASATSAPELCITLIATVLTSSDMGISTIVGSSSFNILFVIAVAGIFAREPVTLKWWPVTRELAWYVVSIIVLAIVLIDDKIYYYESTVMVVLYIIYVIMLVYDKKLRRCFRRKKRTAGETADDDEPVEEIDDENAGRTIKQRICVLPRGRSKCRQVFWVISYPLSALFALTIPSVSVFFPATMLISIIYVGLLCYVVSWFVTVIGYNLLLPESVMGLVVVAAGTSVPEIVISYTVTRQGLGAMAVSNAAGSNTFNTLVCLGLPWLVENIKSKDSIQLDTKGMIFIAVSLLTTAILVQVSFVATKFRLSKVIGFICMVYYFCFTIVATGTFIYLCSR